MKTIKIQKNIAIPDISKVKISNELMGTNLIQSEDDEVHISAELYLRISDDAEEITAEDFISEKTDMRSNSLTITISELDLDEDDYDISHRSEITISIPAELQVSAETDNHYIAASGMKNGFEITNENGPVKLEDCTGDIKITNENGPVKLYKLNGNLSIEEENGAISTDNLSGTKLEIKSENGAIKMRECQFEDVSIINENGMVYYESQLVESGSINIENENGHINLALSPLQGFSLEASAELGQIKNSFMGEKSMAFDNYKLEVGDSALKINLKTENGMIKLTSSDMISGEFLKKKMDMIKELLKDNSELGLTEAHKIIGQLMSSLNNMKDKVNEEAIKEKIEQALAHLKTWKAKINDPEMKIIVKDSIDSVSQEISHTVQEAMKIAQEAIHAAHEKYGEDLKPHFEKHFGKGKEFFKHFKGFQMPPMPPFPPSEPKHRAHAMQEAARIKILEMLEAGKITSEEAEKLLKAIH